MRNRLAGFAFGQMQTGKIANQPLAVVQFPVKWSAPRVAINNFPAFRKPPAKILVTTIAEKLQIVAVADQRAVEGVVLKENPVRGLFVVEGEVVIRRTEDCGLRTVDLCGVSQPEKSACDFRHAFVSCHGGGSGLNCRVILIAKQMLDVVDQQLLMLHLVLEAKPDERQNSFRFRLVLD